MKKIILAFLLSFVATFPGFASSYGKGGRLIHFQQTQGVSLKLLVLGDEYYARTVTLDGYTVVYREEDQMYYYATLNKTKDALIPTSMKVGIDKPVGLVKNIQIDSKNRQKQWMQRYQSKNAERIKRWQKRVEAAKLRRVLKANSSNDSSKAQASKTLKSMPPYAAPVIGNKVGLTILVQFPDDPNTKDVVDPVNFPVTKEAIERFCNTIGYHEYGNTDSVREYFKNQSLDRLDYSMVVSDIVTLPHPRNYYNFSDYPTNKNLRDCGSTGQMIIEDAVTALKNSGFQFNGLTLENTNKVVATNVFFAGDDSGTWDKGLWPHSWAMPYEELSINVDGKVCYISNYQITNLLAEPKIGTFIHENGHLLMDFPDLYDYGDESNGIGHHGIMAGGNSLNREKTPAPICLPLKDVVGWANVTDITKDDYRSVQLPSTGNVGYRIRKPGSNSEYFLVENRGEGDRWAQFVPDKGIMIWHVDETVHGNNNEQMTAALHYQVSLEQSDGRFDLENNVNQGDRDDLYDIHSSLFTDATAVNAHWWDNTVSGISVRVRSVPGSNMLVDFGVKNTVTVNYPNGGEEVDEQGTMTITWYGNFNEKVKIDLYKNGEFFRNIAHNEDNDGTFLWNLGGAYPVGNQYTIVITGENNANNTDVSDRFFSINKELFPKGAKIPDGWVKAPNATKGWEVTTDFSSEGYASLRSIDIDNSQTAAIQYTGNFQAGNLTFKVKISSEVSYDTFHFYLDNVKQSLNGSVSFSGDKDWMAVSIPIPEGEHTFKWSYEKDESMTKLLDTAWIDEVVFPPKVGELSGIALWKSEQFGADAENEAVAGDLADPDGDGLNNLLEYALGLNPKSPSVAPLSVEKSGIKLSIIYTRSKNVNDIEFVIQGSPDMNTWEDLIVGDETISSTTTKEKVKAIYDLTGEGSPTYFLRVKVKYK